MSIQIRRHRSHPGGRRHPLFTYSTEFGGTTVHLNHTMTYTTDTIEANALQIIVNAAENTNCNRIFWEWIRVWKLGGVVECGRRAIAGTTLVGRRTEAQRLGLSLNLLSLETALRPELFEGVGNFNQALESGGWRSTGHCTNGSQMYRHRSSGRGPTRTSRARHYHMPRTLPKA